MGKFAGVFAYADDVLMLGTAKQLQLMLNIAKKIAKNLIHYLSLPHLFVNELVGNIMPGFHISHNESA